MDKIKIIDVSNPERVNRIPDKTEVLFSEGNFSEHGFKINKVELRLYLENTEKNNEPYSLITSFVETDKGSIEMIFQEGFHGTNSLEEAKTFLVSNLGISGLILRSSIALKSALNSN